MITNKQKTCVNFGSEFFEILSERSGQFQFQTRIMLNDFFRYFSDIFSFFNEQNKIDFIFGRGFKNIVIFSEHMNRHVEISLMYFRNFLDYYPNNNIQFVFEFDE